MRFSLRTLLLVAVVVAVAFGWFGIRYRKTQAEQRILSDLEPGVSSFNVARVNPDGELYERYDADLLFELAQRYATQAETKPSGSVAARIAGASLVHLGSKYDMQLEEFIHEPRAVALAEKYFDSNIEPLSTMATALLMRHHRLSDDVHSSQDCRVASADGFDANDPIDVYVLVTEIYSEFYYCDGAYDIRDHWPQPTHPWQWDLRDSAQHSYEDKVTALRQVSPTAAKAYAEILKVLTECDADTNDEQHEQLGSLTDQVTASLPKEAIFRFMLRHLEVFRSYPRLVRPRTRFKTALPARAGLQYKRFRVGKLGFETCSKQSHPPRPDLEDQSNGQPGE